MKIVQSASDFKHEARFTTWALRHRAATPASITCARCRPGATLRSTRAPGQGGDGPTLGERTADPAPQARGGRGSAIGDRDAGSASSARSKALPQSSARSSCSARSATCPSRTSPTSTGAREHGEEPDALRPGAAPGGPLGVRGLCEGPALRGHAAHREETRLLYGLREVRPARDGRALRRARRADVRGHETATWTAAPAARIGVRAGAARPATSAPCRSRSRARKLEARILDAVERRAEEDAVPAQGRSAALGWAGSHAMRPQLAMAALFVLVIGSSLLLLRPKTAWRRCGSPSGASPHRISTRRPAAPRPPPRPSRWRRGGRRPALGRSQGERRAQGGGREGRRARARLRPRSRTTARAPRCTRRKRCNASRAARGSPSASFRVGRGRRAVPGHAVRARCDVGGGPVLPGLGTRRRRGELLLALRSARGYGDRAEQQLAGLEANAAGAQAQNSAPAAAAPAAAARRAMPKAAMPAAPPRDAEEPGAAGSRGRRPPMPRCRADGSRAPARPAPPPSPAPRLDLTARAAPRLDPTARAAPRPHRALRWRQRQFDRTGASRM